MRLIDADVLGKTDRPVGKLMMFGGEYVYTQTEIDRAPTIDAVPVVRCRECIHADDYGHCEMQNFWGTRDDYCSRGKRREDGDGDG